MSIHLAAHELCKSRRRTPIVGPVTLVAGPGAPLAITGPPGSGKTTLLQLLTGRLKPTSGAVTVNGEDLAKPGVRAALRDRTARVRPDEGPDALATALFGAAALVVLDEPFAPDTDPARVLALLTRADPVTTVLVAARNLHGLRCRAVLDLTSPPGVLRLNER
ncbi:ABC-type Mn2+/Zn2+ transport system ATPase subunit [Crossiella equi]|uniref:ABC-type Mn2+/Zn2+ transport system ATPase subunit n=1 Tax=Crossiella equi TaxID=130796 RepID=A0ABS5AJD9_9PSEU|nr:ABC transporter ATP-binding protein [Crossiella equi]MBP2476684.1 ABC-type Mn2+/Zn2+ transport system ATPase subunit [Crossiella equi]